MKKYILLLFVTIQFSCEKNGLVSVPVNLTGSVEFTVAASDPNTVDKTITIDAASYPDLQNRLSMIKGYTINSISYQVVNFSGIAGNKLSGNISIGAVSVSVSNIPLDLPTVYKLTLTSDQLNTIASDFLSGNNVTIRFNGNVSSKPAYARVLFIVDASVRVL